MSAVEQRWEFAWNAEVGVTQRRLDTGIGSVRVYPQAFQVEFGVGGRVGFVVGLGYVVDRCVGHARADAAVF